MVVKPSPTTAPQLHLQLRLRRVLPDVLEDGSELLGVDDSVVVGVELEEGVLEGADLLLREALGRHDSISSLLSGRQSRRYNSPLVTAQQ